MSSSVYIIVLNWNNAPDTMECLRSLAALDYPNYNVLVVDNGSTDDSVTLIRSAFPEIDILQTGANLGYAGGNNAGIRHALAAGADLVCILNNDVTVEPGFLTPLVETLAIYPSTAVVTPLVAERVHGGRVWALGSAVDRRTASVTRRHAGDAVDNWRHRSPFEVDIASGAAMLVRAEVFERVELMDEDFFLYFEEVDWSLLMRRAGYRIMAVPASIVWHKVSSTLGATSPVIDYYMLRNQLRLIGRHWSGLPRLLLLSRTVLHGMITVVAYTVKSQRGRRLPSRSARLLALRDALLHRWGEMGSDVSKVCSGS